MERYRPNLGEFTGGKKKIVIADISESMEAKAKDVALEKSTESAEKPKGFLNKIKNFGKTIWKRSEIFQAKERYKAEEEIKKTGNIFAHEQGSKEAHDKEVEAITNRFSTKEEFKETFIHEGAGETRETLGDSRQEQTIKNRLQSLLKEYARGNVNEAEFYLAKDNIFADIKGIKPEALGKGKMYADNLFQLAKEAKEEVRRQVEQRIDQEIAVNGLDLDFEVVVGRAKAGVRTEAQFNAVDSIVDKIQRYTGGIFNESSVAVGVAVANTVFKKVVQGSVKRAASVFGLGVLASGAVGAAKESRKLEVERMQHAREKAQGKEVKNPALAKRREELEKSRIQTKSARELESNLYEAIFSKLNGREVTELSEVDYNKALVALADIDSRIQISDNGIVKNPKTNKLQFWRSNKAKKIDLIGYSDVTQVDQERNNLDILRARAKVELKKWATAHGKDLAVDLSAKKNEKSAELFNGESGITRQNEIFHKLKKEKVWRAAWRGALVGGAIGLAMQEAHAFIDDNQEGAIEHLFKEAHDHLPGEKATLAEGIRRRIEEAFDHTEHGTNFEHLHDQAVGGHHFELPEGYKIESDGNGGYQIFDQDHAVTDSFKLNADGSLTSEARHYLAEHHFGPHENYGHQGTPDQHIAETEHQSTLEVLKAKFAGLAKHKRVDWHDNPGKHYSDFHHKLIEFEGKQQNLFLEQSSDGTVSVDAHMIVKNLIMNMKEYKDDPLFGMNPDGSYDQKLIDSRDNLEQWIKDGTLQDHLQVAIIPTDEANHNGLSMLYEGAVEGKIALPHEISSMFTNPSMFRDGHLPFKFMELRLDGHVLATAKGSGIDIQSLTNSDHDSIIPGNEGYISTVIGRPENPNDFITQPPYILPLGRREGLEEMERVTQPPLDPPPPPPPSSSESNYESGRETLRQNGEQARQERISSGVADMQQDIVDVYFDDDGDDDKQEKLQHLQTLYQNQTSPEKQKEFYKLVNNFYKWRQDALVNNPYDTSKSASSSEWAKIVNKSLDPTLKPERKKEIAYYVSNYLEEQSPNIPDADKSAYAETIIQLLRIAEIKTQTEPTVKSAEPVISNQTPEELAQIAERERIEQKIVSDIKPRFEANPLDFIYGKAGLEYQTATGIKAKTIVPVLFEAEGFTGQMEAAKEQAKFMQGDWMTNRTLAQLARLMAENNPSLLDKWKASNPKNFERWALEINDKEVRDKYNNGNLTDAEINTISSKFNLPPIKLMERILFLKSSSRTEFNKDFAAAGSPPGRREEILRATLQRLQGRRTPAPIRPRPPGPVRPASAPETRTVARVEANPTVEDLDDLDDVPTDPKRFLELFRKAKAADAKQGTEVKTKIKRKAPTKTIAKRKKQ